MSVPTVFYSAPLCRPHALPNADAAPPPFREDPPGPPIIAFCHLPWSGVWQRPQQFLSRLSRRHRVLFVETYCSPVANPENRSQPAPGYPNVTILQMHLPEARWSDGHYIDLQRRRLLDEFRGSNASYDDPILWFNDPMAVVAFAGHCAEAAIVYDCMDELAQFKGAPPELAVRERELLRVADVVFCGGRKMRDKRLPLNPNTYFYGTGVDCAHFGRVSDPALAVDPQIAALGDRVLGYFGVIDERIDYDLLAALADALPDCQIAMVGPTAKVDPAGFPQRPNLHWLGRREYADLPAITKGFAVCLMPFALNAATEYINPTKALEYLAAGRPVVSTAIAEVLTNFADVCHVGRSRDEFIAACRACLDTPDPARRAAGLQLAQANTWDAITAKLEAHLVASTETHAGHQNTVRVTNPLATGAWRKAYV